MESVGRVLARSHAGSSRCTIVASRQGVDLAGAPVDQLVATRLLADADRWVAERRAALTRSLRETEDLLREIRPAWRWTTPTGGVGLWVDVGTDTAALCARYRQRDVLLVPGPSFSATDGCARYVRLPLGHPVDVVAEALGRVPEQGRPAPTTSRG